METKLPAPTLHDLQKWMQWIITDPRGTTPALENHPPKLPLPAEPAPRCLEMIADQPPLDRVRRLDIYAEGYVIRLVESLSDDFKTVKRLIGPSRFQELVEDYLADSPSRTHTVADVGRGLADFLKGHAFTERFAFLPEMATLEWAVVQSFYADDRPPFDQTVLSSIPLEAWSSARFQLDSSVFLLPANWTLHKAWNDPKSYGKVLARKIRPEKTYLLLHRQDDEVWLDDLSEMQFILVQRLAAGLSFDAVMDAIYEKTGEEPESIQACFSSSFGPWVGAGIIRGIDWEGKNA